MMGCWQSYSYVAFVICIVQCAWRSEALDTICLGDNIARTKGGITVTDTSSILAIQPTSPSVPSVYDVNNAFDEDSTTAWVTNDRDFTPFVKVSLPRVTTVSGVGFLGILTAGTAVRIQVTLYNDGFQVGFEQFDLPALITELNDFTFSDLYVVDAFQINIILSRFGSTGARAIHLYSSTAECIADESTTGGYTTATARQFFRESSTTFVRNGDGSFTLRVTTPIPVLVSASISPASVLPFLRQQATSSPSTQTVINIPLSSIAPSVGSSNLPLTTINWVAFIPESNAVLQSPNFISNIANILVSVNLISDTVGEGDLITDFSGFPLMQAETISTVSTTRSSATLQFRTPSTTPALVSVAYGESSVVSTTKRYKTNIRPFPTSFPCSTTCSVTINSLLPNTIYDVYVVGHTVSGFFRSRFGKQFRTNALDDVDQAQCIGANVALLEAGGTISAASSTFLGGGANSQWGANNVIDGDNNSPWITDNDGLNTFVEIRLPQVQQVSGIGFWSWGTVDTTYITRITVTLKDSNGGILGSEQFHLGALPTKVETIPFATNYQNVKSVKIDVDEIFVSPTAATHGIDPGNLQQSLNTAIRTVRVHATADNCVARELCATTNIDTNSNCGTVRLRDGPTSRRGRVEFLWNGQYGTVCDDSWDNFDAAVTCKQLGFQGGTAPRSSEQTPFGPGIGTIWLDGVRCQGTEDRLVDCTFDPIGQTNCIHQEDAVAFCYQCGDGIVDSWEECDDSNNRNGDGCSNNCRIEPGFKCNAGACVQGAIEGEIVLIGGVNGNTASGRLMIHHNHQWGTVCDDSFGAPDVQVVCRSLGYDAGRLVNTFGPGHDLTPIWLANLECVGNEASLSDCGNAVFGNHNCVHREDVSIECFNNVPLCTVDCEDTGFEPICLTNVDSVQEASRNKVTVQNSCDMQHFLECEHPTETWIVRKIGSCETVGICPIACTPNSSTLRLRCMSSNHDGERITVIDDCDEQILRTCEGPQDLWTEIFDGPCSDIISTDGSTADDTTSDFTDYLGADDAVVRQDYTDAVRLNDIITDGYLGLGDRIGRVDNFDGGYSQGDYINPYYSDEYYNYFNDYTDITTDGTTDDFGNVDGYADFVGYTTDETSGGDDNTDSDIVQRTCIQDEDCNDNDDCTQDVCFAGLCNNLIVGTDCCRINADCDDKNTCTVESCVNHRCLRNRPRADCCISQGECEDGNPCTVNRCNLNTQTCTVVEITNCCALDGDCADGNGCTTEQCINNICVYTQLPPGSNCCASSSDCNDNNRCTRDLCVLGSCQNQLTGTCCSVHEDCDDFNVCTDDGCFNGNCVNTPVFELCCLNSDDCQDSDPCTINSCIDNRCSTQRNPSCDATSCNSHVQCDNLNPCDEDFCFGNQCQHFQLTDFCCVQDTDCEDDDPCTTNFCDVDATCQETRRPVCDGQSCSSNLQCNDLDECTDDICVFNVCQNTPKEFCVCDTVFDCDDGDWCTIEECRNNRCTHVEIPLDRCCRGDTPRECDDGIQCTIDQCLNNVCMNIKNSILCCLSNDDCDDGKPCTQDMCLFNSCRNIQFEDCCNGNTECDDGNSCTLESCSTENRCVAHGIKDEQGCCSSSDQCTDFDGDVCTPVVCRNNKCQNDLIRIQGCCNNVGDCNSILPLGTVLDPCVVITCTDNLCSSTKVTENCCSNNLQCGFLTPEDPCLKPFCKFDIPFVSTTGSCQLSPVTGCCTVAAHCDDNDSCTDDSCTFGTNQCRNVRTDNCCAGESDDECDDNNSCTTDSCVDSRCGHTVIEGCATSKPCKPTGIQSINVRARSARNGAGAELAFDGDHNTFFQAVTGAVAPALWFFVYPTIVTLCSATIHLDPRMIGGNALITLLSLREPSGNLLTGEGFTVFDNIRLNPVTSNNRVIQIQGAPKGSAFMVLAASTDVPLSIAEVTDISYTDVCQSTSQCQTTDPFVLASSCVDSTCVNSICEVEDVAQCCTRNNECDDGLKCTQDVCGDGKCVFEDIADCSPECSPTDITAIESSTSSSTSFTASNLLSDNNKVFRSVESNPFVRFQFANVDTTTCGGSIVFGQTMIGTSRTLTWSVLNTQSGVAHKFRTQRSFDLSDGSAYTVVTEETLTIQSTNDLTRSIPRMTGIAVQISVSGTLMEIAEIHQFGVDQGACHSVDFRDEFGTAFNDVHAPTLAVDGFRDTEFISPNVNDPSFYVTIGNKADDPSKEVTICGGTIWLGEQLMGNSVTVTISMFQTQLEEYSAADIDTNTPSNNPLGDPNRYVPVYVTTVRNKNGRISLPTEVLTGHAMKISVDGEGQTLALSEISTLTVTQPKCTKPHIFFISSSKPSGANDPQRAFDKLSSTRFWSRDANAALWFQFGEKQTGGHDLVICDGAALYLEKRHVSKPVKLQFYVFTQESVGNPEDGTDGYSLMDTINIDKLKQNQRLIQIPQYRGIALKIQIVDSSVGLDVREITTFRVTGVAASLREAVLEDYVEPPPEIFCREVGGIAPHGTSYNAKASRAFDGDVDVSYVSSKSDDNPALFFEFSDRDIPICAGTVIFHSKMAIGSQVNVMVRSLATVQQVKASHKWDLGSFVLAQSFFLTESRTIQIPRVSGVSLAIVPTSGRLWLKEVDQLSTEGGCTKADIFSLKSSGSKSRRNMNRAFDGNPKTYFESTIDDSDLYFELSASSDFNTELCAAGSIVLDNSHDGQAIEIIVSAQIGSKGNVKKGTGLVELTRLATFHLSPEAHTIVIPNVVHRYIHGIRIQRVGSGFLHISEINLSVFSNPITTTTTTQSHHLIAPTTAHHSHVPTFDMHGTLLSKYQQQSRIISYGELDEDELPTTTTTTTNTLITNNSAGESSEEQRDGRLTTSEVGYVILGVTLILFSLIVMAIPISKLNARSGKTTQCKHQQYHHVGGEVTPDHMHGQNEMHQI